MVGKGGWSPWHQPHDDSMRWTTLGVLLGIGAAAFLCSGGDDALAVPATLGTPDPDRIAWPDDEPATAAQIALGRQLFFDPRLSRDGIMSCATCHDPARGWADGLTTARGHAGRILPRNTPGLTNVAFGSIFYWDGRAGSLEEQALSPLTHPDEMALTREEIVPRLEPYRALFASAFPQEGLTVATAVRAIASFERTLISRNSPFDRYLAGERAALSPAARRGMQVFDEASCTFCHRGPNFTNQAFHNIGVGGADDPGRFAIQAGATLRGAFKTPTLRNVALTAPYFHNGSAATLAEVVAFYNRGGDVAGHTPLIFPLGLSSAEQADLVAFLEALTDPIVVERPALP